MLPAALETPMITNHHSLPEFITILFWGIIISLLFSIVLLHVCTLKLNGFCINGTELRVLGGGGVLHLSTISRVSWGGSRICHLTLRAWCSLIHPQGYLSIQHMTVPQCIYSLGSIFVPDVYSGEFTGVDRSNRAHIGNKLKCYALLFAEARSWISPAICRPWSTSKLLMAA